MNPILDSLTSTLFNFIDEILGFYDQQVPDASAPSDPSALCDYFKRIDEVDFLHFHDLNLD